EEYELRKDFLCFARLRVDELHALRFTSIFIYDHFVYDRVGTKLEVSRLKSGRQCAGIRTEISSVRATPRTKIPELTCASALHGLRKVCRAAYGNTDIGKFCAYFFTEVLFNTRHLHRRLKLSVGQLRNAFGLPAYSNKTFDIIVPRGDVFISYRPVDTVPVF